MLVVEQQLAERMLVAEQGQAVPALKVVLRLAERMLAAEQPPVVRMLGAVQRPAERMLAVELRPAARTPRVAPLLVELTLGAAQPAARTLRVAQLVVRMSKVVLVLVVPMAEVEQGRAALTPKEARLARELPLELPARLANRVAARR